MNNELNNEQGNQQQGNHVSRKNVDYEREHVNVDCERETVWIYRNVRGS